MKTIQLTVLATILTFAPMTANAEQTADAAAPQRSIGNGEKNWIITDGSTRDGNTITFPEVQIDGNGWLVMHPFQEGKPNGNVYVGYTYVKDGSNKDVDIILSPEPQSGDMYIVMLHRDVNENQTFDFVFIDGPHFGEGTHVLDRAVFEGTRMIGHAYPAP